MTDPRCPATLWDRPVRFLHWSIAALFLINYFGLEGGSDLHEWTGYALLLLVVLRLAWGLVGSPPARLKNIWPSRARLNLHLRHFRLTQVHEGHSPLGGLMAFALWGAILVSGISGWISEWDMFWGEDWTQLLHEYSAHVLLGLVILHISAVLLIQFFGRVNLVQRMIRGRRSWR